MQALIDHLKQTSPTLVNELIPDLVNVGIIQRVLQNLLKEGISIKNLAVIMECIGDFAPVSKNPDDLSEQVRKRLGHLLCFRVRERAGHCEGDHARSEAGAIAHDQGPAQPA